MFEEADRSFEIEHGIAQQGEVKKFISAGDRREEYSTTIMKTLGMTGPSSEESVGLLGATTASPAASLACGSPCIAGTHHSLLGPTRPGARRRRGRRGRTLHHRHRLSKHRRYQRARCSTRVIGAPRNNNEFLMSQYDEGLALQEAPISNPTPVHYHGIDCECESDDELLCSREGFLATGLVAGRSDANLTCSFVTPTRVSPGSRGSSPSDYSSLPSSPDEDSGCHVYKDLFLTAFHCQHPERTEEVKTGYAGVVMDGTDADFQRRNFEEEYADNITRGLEEASKEELISKCMLLTERLRQLEHGKAPRIAKDHELPSDRLPF